MTQAYTMSVLRRAGRSSSFVSLLPWVTHGAESFVRPRVRRHPARAERCLDEDGIQSRDKDEGAIDFDIATGSNP